MCEECPGEVLDLARRMSAWIGEQEGHIRGGLQAVFEDENVATGHLEWCAETQQLSKPEKQFTLDLLKLPVPSRHAAVWLAWERVSFDQNGRPVYGWPWEAEGASPDVR